MFKKLFTNFKKDIIFKILDWEHNLVYLTAKRSVHLSTLASHNLILGVGTIEVQNYLTNVLFIRHPIYRNNQDTF